MDRTVDVDGMVDHLVDPVSRVAVIYVSADQDLSNIKIRTLNLGGAYGRVTPDPTTVRDFTYPQTFYAARAGEGGMAGMESGDRAKRGRCLYLVERLPHGDESHAYRLCAKRQDPGGGI